MEKPFVSIIIRTKNEERWITSCLKSVSRQSYKNFEIIIVDNHSSDKTIEKVLKVRALSAHGRGAAGAQIRVDLPGLPGFPVFYGLAHDRLGAPDTPDVKAAPGPP